MTRQAAPKKILYVVRSFPTWSETFIWDKIRFLKRNHYDAKVLSLAEGDRALNKEERRLLNLRTDLDYLVAGGRGALRRSVLCFLREFFISPYQALLWLGASRKAGFLAEDWLKRWRRFLAFDRWRPDLVHVHYAHTAYGFLPWKKHHESKWIISLLGFDITRYEGRDSEDHKKVFREADCLICTSRFLEKTAVSLGAPKEKIRILPTGVDLDLFSFCDRSGCTSKQVKILTVARLVWEKGHGDALQSVANLVALKKDVYYTIVGDGPLLADLKETVSDLGIKKYVEFRGTADPLGVKKALEEADIFLFPSHLEAFGAALVEAQATGLPVVATRVGGIPEAVSEGESAILVSPSSPEEISDALLKLIDDPELRLEMGCAGRRHVEKNFDSHHVEERLLDIYRECIPDL